MPHGSPWLEIPERYSHSTTCYNRFVRWRKGGVWDRRLFAVAAAFEGEIVMIDSTCVRVDQHGAKGKKGEARNYLPEGSCAFPANVVAGQRQPR